jgi:hypothetical protein
MPSEVDRHAIPMEPAVALMAPIGVRQIARLAAPVIVDRRIQRQHSGIHVGEVPAADDVVLGTEEGNVGDGLHRAPFGTASRPLPVDRWTCGIRASFICATFLEYRQFIVNAAYDDDVDVDVDRSVTHCHACHGVTRDTFT